MPSLKDMKQRLEKLPDLRRESKLADYFGTYSSRIEASYEKFLEASKTAENISDVFPESNCLGEVQALIRKAVVEAKKIQREIEEDPENVAKKRVENEFLRIGELAANSSLKYREKWKCEISRNVDKWRKLSDVVSNLKTKGGSDFKAAVDSLQGQQPPVNSTEAERSKEALKKLRHGIGSMGLEGKFGLFLEKSVNFGASPRDVLDPEVSSKLNEFELWDSFKIRLI